MMKFSWIIGCVLMLFIGSSCGSADDETTSGDQVNSVSDSTADSLLSVHNLYRQDVGIEDFVWSETLAASAQSWADQLAADCSFEHSDSPYGENIWKGTTGFFNVNDVVNKWGSEVEDYDYDNNSCSAVCGHYTQVVWKNTQRVGCGVSTCDGQDIWVCQYDPPGNFVGQRPY